MQESEPEVLISCEDARNFIIDRLQHSFDDEVVAADSQDFIEAVTVGFHAANCSTKICRFLGLTHHTRNSGTEIDFDATMRKVEELRQQEEEHFS